MTWLDLAGDDDSFLRIIGDRGPGLNLSSFARLSSRAPCKPLPQFFKVQLRLFRSLNVAADLKSADSAYLRPISKRPPHFLSGLAKKKGRTKVLPSHLQISIQLFLAPFQGLVARLQAFNQSPPGALASGDNAGGKVERNAGFFATANGDNLGFNNGAAFANNLGPQGVLEFAFGQSGSHEGPVLGRRSAGMSVHGQPGIRGQRNLDNSGGIDVIRG